MSGADEAGAAAAPEEAGADPAADQAVAEVATDDVGATAAKVDGGVTAASHEAEASAAEDGAEAAAATDSAEPPAEAGDAGQAAAEPAAPDAEASQEAAAPAAEDAAPADGDQTCDAPPAEAGDAGQAAAEPAAPDAEASQESAAPTAEDAAPAGGDPTGDAPAAEGGDAGQAAAEPAAPDAEASQEAAAPTAEDAAPAGGDPAGDASAAEAGDVGQAAAEPAAPHAEASQEAAAPTAEDAAPACSDPVDATVTEEAALAQVDGAPTAVEGAPEAVPVEETSALEGVAAQKADEGASDVAPQAEQGAGASAPGEEPQAEDVKKASEEGSAEAAQSAQDVVPEDNPQAAQGETPQGEGVPDTGQVRAGEAPQDVQELAKAETDDVERPADEAAQSVLEALSRHAQQFLVEEVTKTVPVTSVSLESEHGTNADARGTSPLKETPVALDPRVGYAADSKASPTSTVASPLSSSRKSIKTKPVSSVQNPGVVIYVVAPMMASEATLTNEEYTVITATGLRSGASIVLSARSSESVVALDQGPAGVDRILRPLAEFAVRRFRIPGSSKAGPQLTAFAQLFDALAQPGRSEASVAGLAQGLHALGYRGDAETAAEATLGAGRERVTRRDFCDALGQVFDVPDIIAVRALHQTPLASSLKTKKRNSQSESLQESPGPVVRMVDADDFELAGDVALQTKVDEAVRIAGPAGYGVILLLTGRGRTLLRPTEYERQMRAELQFAVEGLPPDWPLLWYPGPAEVGFLPAGNSPQRSNWAMPQASRPEDLQGWLRYLLSVRPLAPAT